MRSVELLKMNILYFVFKMDGVLNDFKSSDIFRTFCTFEMRIIGRKIILKLKWKNIGNKKLCNAIDQLLADLETFDFKVATITDIRKDADCVHSEGFYFFNIHIHRTLILIEMDDEGEATLVWAGSHQEYERTFKNNKAIIAKWLRTKNYIE